MFSGHVTSLYPNFSSHDFNSEFLMIQREARKKLRKKGENGVGFYKAHARVPPSLSFLGFVRSRFADFNDRKFATEMNLIRNGIKTNLRKKGQFPPADTTGHSGERRMTG